MADSRPRTVEMPHRADGAHALSSLGTEQARHAAAAGRHDAPKERVSAPLAPDRALSIGPTPALCRVPDYAAPRFQRQGRSMFPVKDLGIERLASCPGYRFSSSDHYASDL